MRDRVQGLRWVRASELIPHPENWRTHPPEQRRALRAMVDRIGNASALYVREIPEGLQILDGHMRQDLLADEQVPVVVLDLDDDEARAFLATLDPIAAMAKADRDKLSELLKPLQDLPALDWRKLYGVDPHKRTIQHPRKPDDVPEPVEVTAKTGDLWQLGDHRVMCGDCTQPADVERLLGGVSPDCILTDPPYSSGGFQEAERSRGSKGTVVAYRPITNDRLSSRGYMALLKQALAAAPAEVLYLFTDWRMWVNAFDVAEGSGYGVRSMIVWDKQYPGMGMGWRSQHELILCGTKSNGLWKKHQGAQGNVIGLARQPNVLHAVQKPVELLETILRATPFARTVYDPFGGSGSTLVAAERQARVCYTMEVDIYYTDVIIKRWEEYTGEKAAKL